MPQIGICKEDFNPNEVTALKGGIMLEFKRFKVQKLLLTVDEVMKLLSYKSENSVMNLIRRGEIDAHCVNGVDKGQASKPVRIVATSLSAYVARHTIPAQKWSE